MKKFVLLSLCVFSLVVVTGCGGGSKKQVTCTAKMSEDGMNMTVSIIADLDKDDKVTAVKEEMDLGDKTTAETYCNLYKLFVTDDSGMKIDCSGSKIIISNLETLDMDDEGGEKIIGISKDEFISKAKANTGETEVTCK